MFNSLEFEGSRHGSVAVSIVVHAFLLTAAIAVPMFLLDTLNVRKTYDVTLLAPRIPEKPTLEVTLYKPVARPPSVPLPAAKLTTPLVNLPEPPKPEERAEVKPPDVPKPSPTPPPVIEPVREIPAPPKIVTPEPRREPPPAPTVRTNVFGGGAAAATTNLPARQVQTGGFGDPSGARGAGHSDKPSNIASLGSFDLTVGAGAGNGAGGAQGVRGIVSNGGFDRGSGAVPDSTRRASAVTSTGFTAGPAASSVAASNRSVQNAAFGDLRAADAPTKRRASEIADTAVEVTYKARAEYTKEARAARIEGEVLVRVQFLASGQTKVLGVERGLGYGLDETAVRATEGIRFKPATHEGSPVDSTAVVRILFQLAN